MALKKEFITPQGFTVSQEDSYLKITHISGNKDNMFAIISFQNSLRKECMTLDVNFIPVISEDAGDFLHQAYEAFKLLPSFEGYVDA